MSSKDTVVSFTIRRPPPSISITSSSTTLPRRPALPTTHSSRPSSTSSSSFAPAAPPDTSDDDSSSTEAEQVEFLSGFDQSGPQRLNGKSKRAEGPLVIPPLANRDWRAIARQRKGGRGKGEMYTPTGGVPAGEDGSQGGLGTRDSINSGPQVAGLVIRRKEEEKEETVENTVVETVEEATSTLVAAAEAETEMDEDERARQALLASINGGDATHDGSTTIDIIPVSDNNLSRPISETDAYRQDVVTRPDSASLEDYERVPISQFGAALLRGMGWKEGTAASRRGRGMVEPWLPPSRPALLGLGAKERAEEDVPGKKGSRKANNKQRYIPVAKVQKEESLVVKGRTRSRSPDRSRTSSRYPSSEAADKGEREYRHDSSINRDSRYYYDRTSGSGSDHHKSHHRSQTSTGSEMRKHGERDRYSREGDRRREDGDGGRRRDKRDYDYEDGRRDSSRGGRS